MNIEVIGTMHYLVSLSDDDMKLVKDWLKEHDDLPYYNDKDNICAAIMVLYENGDIDLFSDDKFSKELEFEIEEVQWSEFERHSPKEILENI